MHSQAIRLHGVSLQSFDERREMIAQVEEALEVAATEDEFSKESKIKYTRALLLEFTEAEVCQKLPRDFDLLILRELGGESDRKIEQRSISGSSSSHGPLPRPRWDLGCRGERWDNHLLIPSKESHSQRNCSLERSPQGYGNDAGVLGRHPDLFRLNKSENPYRPPHCNKKMLQPLASFSEPGIESLAGSEQRGSADGITGNDKSGCGLPFAGVDDSTVKPLDECEDSWRNREENKMIDATETLGEIIQDNQLTIDDFWAEILEIIHLQQESTISPVNTRADTPDSDIEIRFPDEESLISVGNSAIPENSNLINLENSDDVANSEAEICLPDEESLISIYDMIAPDSSMLTLEGDSLKAGKVISSMAVYIRKNSESLNVTKQDDQSMTCKGQSSFDLSACGKPHSLLPHSQTSADIFGPEKNSLHLGNDQMNSLPKFMTPNIAPHKPSLKRFSCSNIHRRSCQASTLTRTKPNASLVQYSVSQQPNIFPEQQNHLLVGTSCRNPTLQVATPGLSVMHLLPLTSQQAIYQSFGLSNAVAVDPVVLGGFGDEAASGFFLWNAQ